MLKAENLTPTKYAPVYGVLLGCLTCCQLALVRAERGVGLCKHPKLRLAFLSRVHIKNPGPRLAGDLARGRSVGQLLQQRLQLMVDAAHVLCQVRQACCRGRHRDVFVGVAAWATKLAARAAVVLRRPAEAPLGAARRACRAPQSRELLSARAIGSIGDAVVAGSKLAARPAMLRA
eukprot:365179-Chlamydomonas_euryale.AAC.3